ECKTNKMSCSLHEECCRFRCCFHGKCQTSVFGCWVDP
uniref:Conotoxin r11e n=1 Tax=Conus radiatus TaxID=61198 RepID=I1BE_CONRA|nr:RecName: Full=Conotoxin r11e [Conus radiatus]